MNDNTPPDLEERQEQYLEYLLSKIESTLAESVDDYKQKYLGNDPFMGTEEFIGILGKHATALCWCTIRSLMILAVYHDNKDFPYEVLEGLRNDMDKEMTGFDDFKEYVLMHTIVENPTIN